MAPPRLTAQPLPLGISRSGDRLVHLDMKAGPPVVLVAAEPDELISASLHRHW
jgi:hypothetical protein